MKENFCFFSKKILYLMSNTGFMVNYRNVS